MSLSLHHLRFGYEGALRPLFDDLSLHLDPGWTGVVGPNGAGKSTLLRLAIGSLEPSAGQVRRPERTRYCAQRTDHPPQELDELLSDWSDRAHRLRARLGVEEDFGTRWEVLSHGERKRAQLAVALWSEPDLLAVDEPTNHLDAGARHTLGAALSRYRGIGLLVSHDRDLLDQLCHQCLWLEAHGPVLRPGGYTQGRESAAEERTHDLRARHAAERELSRLQREAQARSQAAARSQRRRSRRGLARGDSDMRAKIGAAILTGKDTRAAQGAKRMEARVQRAASALGELRVHDQARTGIHLEGSVSRRDRVTVAPAARLPLGPGRVLEVPDLEVLPSDRIAVEGPNGAGKTTLLAHLRRHLRVEPAHLLDLPQELSASRAREVLSSLEHLDRQQRGAVLTAVARLGTDAASLMDSAQPSPGEARKLMVALALSTGAHLALLDEPTNHLDLPATEALEEALAAWPGACVLVSHDRRFREALTSTRWVLEERGDTVQLLRLC